MLGSLQLFLQSIMSDLKPSFGEFHGNVVIKETKWNNESTKPVKSYSRQKKCSSVVKVYINWTNSIFSLENQYESPKI